MEHIKYKECISDEGTAGWWCVKREDGFFGLFTLRNCYDFEIKNPNIVGSPAWNQRLLDNGREPRDWFGSIEEMNNFNNENCVRALNGLPPLAPDAFK